MKITLKAARIDARLTQKQVAEALNTTSSRLASWENGKTDIPHRYVNPFCELVGVCADDLNFLLTDTEIPH